MSALLMTGSRVCFEIDLGLLILGGIAAIGGVALMFYVGYHLGRKEAPARALHIQGGLEGQCAAKDEVIAKVMALNVAQAGELGAARGAVEHLRAAGL